MYYEQQKVMEQVEVIAHFHNLDIDILKFKWNGKVYKVDQITNKWKIPDGVGFRTHFIVLSKDNELVYELAFNHTDMKWELIQYDTLN